MKCDGSPDPTNQGEINTFMNLWREDMTEKEVNAILKGSQLTLGVSFFIFITDTEKLTFSSKSGIFINLNVMNC